MLTKKDFKKFVKKIQEDTKNALKIKIYNSASTPNGASGEYFRNVIDIAIGPTPGNRKVDWPWKICVLAHEYKHYLRDCRNSKKYTKKINLANDLLYSKTTSPKVRARAARIVMRDEYYTDIETYEKVLKDWGIQNYYKDNWWKNSNCYNYIIKYLLETGIFFRDAKDVLKVPNHKFTLQEIYRPLSQSKRKEIDRLIASKQLLITVENYEDTIE